MKIRHLKAAAFIAMLSGLVLQPMSAFAENYGIVYEGGEPLSEENIQIDPELKLKAVVRAHGEPGKYVDMLFSDSGKWEHGYMLLNGKCQEVGFFGVSGDMSKEEMGDTSVIYYGDGNYYVEIRFSRVSVEGAPFEDGEAIAMHVDPWIETGGIPYTDSQCTNAVEGIVNYHYSGDRKIFVETNVKLYRKDSNEVVAPSEGLYVKLYDIDAGQSYKILNSSNLLSRSNMYARTTEGLNGDNPDSPLKNMYVTDGNYIYSQYTLSGGLSAKNADIFIKINEETLREGINFVLGYVSSAGSFMEFGAKVYVVTYASDENGFIDGIESEKIVSSDVPSGSVVTSNSGYELDYWIADKDVILKNGETIKAGEPITAEQIKQVVVTEDLTFTAIHKAEILAPNTGFSTSETNAASIVSVSLAVIMLGALATFGVVSKLSHKKVDFRK